MFACREGHTEAAKVLAENGAQLNLQKEEWGSPLMLACKEGHSGVVKLLLEKGAQADLQDNRGRSALMYSSERNKLEVAKYY